MRSGCPVESHKTIVHLIFFRVLWTGKDEKSLYYTGLSMYFSGLDVF